MNITFEQQTEMVWDVLQDGYGVGTIMKIPSIKGYEHLAGYSLSFKPLNGGDYLMYTERFDSLEWCKQMAETTLKNNMTKHEWLAMFGEGIKVL